MKKKILIAFIVIIVIIVASIFALIQYISPSGQLTMDYTPVNVEEKIVNMVTNLNNEVRLSEQDVESLIKQSMDQQLNAYTYINGGKFYVEHNILYAVLNVTLYNKLDVEIHAAYDVQWEGSGLQLLPQSLSVKDISLPTSWLEAIIVPIYNENESIVTISSIVNEGREMIIKLQLNLFNRSVDK